MLLQTFEGPRVPISKASSSSETAARLGLLEVITAWYVRTEIACGVAVESFATFINFAQQFLCWDK
jgi:hypothetical protein